MPGRTPPDMLTEYEKGQRLRAADANAFIRVAKATLLGDGVGDSDAFSNATGYRDLPEFLFKNTSASTCPAGGLLKPGAYTTTGIRALEITRPDGTAPPSWRYAVNVSGPTVENGYGWARWMLEHWSENVALFGVDPASDSSVGWGPKKDDWALWPKRQGFLKLDVVNSTLKLARVVQILGLSRFAVLTGTMVHGGSATAAVLQRNATDDGWEVSDMTYTAYDLFLNVDDSIDADVIVQTSLYCGLDVVSAIYCKANDWLAGYY